MLRVILVDMYHTIIFWYWNQIISTSNYSFTETDIFDNLTET